jgi:hypothetical protein
MSISANLTRFTLSGAVVAFSWATLGATALAQLGAPTNKEEASKSAAQRKDIEVEAMIPGIAHPAEAKQAVRQDLTLLADPGSVSPVDQLKAEINATNAELKKTKQLIGELLASQKERTTGAEPPPLKDAEIRIFTLQRMKAVQAAEMVQSLLDHQSVRIAVDERTNGLIVIGKKEPLLMVEALLQQLDQQAKSADGSQPPDATGSAGATRRTLTLRVFWLADGLPENEGEPIEGISPEFFPDSVRHAVGRLGLQGPRLVTQTVNSISVEEGGSSVEFSTSVPAILFDQPVTLTCNGTMAATTDNRADVDMQLTVGGSGVDCNLKGSVATPLGHYMVLGTANSVIPEQQAIDPAAVGGGGMGMGMPMGGMPPAKYNASRFAFVVQVIEAESFEPEANGQ